MGMGLLVALFCTVSLWCLYDVVVAKDAAAFRYTKQLTEVDDLRAVYQETIASFRGWVLMHNPEMKSHYLDTRASLRRRMDDLRRREPLAGEEERSLLLSIRRLARETVPRTDYILSLPDDEALWAKAKTIYTKEILPRSVELDGALRSYIWLVRGQLETARADFRQTVQHATVLVGLTGLFSLSGIFALLFFVLNAYRRLRVAESVEKQARATSELAERRYRDLVQGLDGGIVWEADPLSFRPIYVSPAAEACTGIPSAEWLRDNRFWENHIPWEDQDRFFAMLRSGVERSLREGPETVRCEHRFLTKEGKVMWFQTGAHVVRDLPGSTSLVRALSVDVTAMKQAHEALRRSEQFNKGIVESCHDCIFVLDSEGRIFFVNPPSRSLLELSDFGTLMNLPWIELWPASETSKVRESLEQARNGRNARFQASWTRVSGEVRHWDVLVTPMADETGTVDRILVVARDITERRRAEEQLRQTTQELSRSNRDLGDFACIASHDLQEPLRAITSYLGLLKARYDAKLEGPMKDYVNSALEGAKRMREFIEGLLNYSQVGSSGEELEPVALDPLLDRVGANLKIPLAESGGTIIRTALPTVHGDGTQLEQLFQNLISNALKFRGEHKPEIRIGCQDGGDEWIFSVEDNGIGFEMAKAGKIFDVFQRLHGEEHYVGCGIGLAVCKRIAERHLGKIWVDWAKVGIGTRICFSLPKNQPLAVRATIPIYHHAQA